MGLMCLQLALIQALPDLFTLLDTTLQGGNYRINPVYD